MYKQDLEQTPLGGPGGDEALCLPPERHRRSS